MFGSQFSLPANHQTTVGGVSVITLRVFTTKYLGLLFMQLIRVFLKTISSKKVLYLFLCAWLVNIVYSYFVLPPSPDDGHYFGAALGFLHKHQTGLYVGDEFELIYATFPGVSFLNGLFLHIMTLLNIGINHYTYRLFHMMAIILLLLSTCYLTYLTCKRDGADYVRGCNIFLVLLAITPFVQMCWAVRPEVLGLLFITIGLIVYSYLDVRTKFISVQYVLSAMFLGLSMAIHPNFVIIAGLLALFIVILAIIERQYFTASSFVFILILPLLVVLAWYLNHCPDSIDELFNGIHRKTRAMPGGGFIRLIKEAFFLSEWGSVFVKIVYSIFWMPLLLILLSSIILAVKENYSMVKRNKRTLLLYVFFISSIIHLALNAQATATYYTITSFILCFFIAVILSKRGTLKDIPLTKNKRLVKVIVTFCLLLIITLHSIIHTIKFTVSAEQYYFLPKAYSDVFEKINSHDHIFIGEPRLYPLFTELVDAQYYKQDSNRVYFLTPGMVSEERTLKIRSFIEKKLKNISHDSSIWGLSKAKTTFMDKDFKRVKYFLDYYMGESIFLEIKIKEIVYEDKDNLIVRPILVTIL